MLRMEGLTENSLDAVSDRDFVAETAFDLSLIMIHLSSLCEELVLWSSHEFGFVKLPESTVERLEHDATEEEPGHPGAGQGEVREGRRRPRSRSSPC